MWICFKFICKMKYDDLRRLELEIMKNPQVGPVIQGTGKLRKM